MLNDPFFAIHAILVLISLNVPIVTIGISFHIHVIQGSVMHVVLNMSNSFRPKPLFFVLTVLYAHCLIPELIYSFKKDKIKTFHHFNFNKLRKTFQFELIRLIQEASGLKKPEEKNRLYKNHPKGFYVYAKPKSIGNNSKNIQGCVNYC